MNERTLDHVGIAVESLDAALSLWTELLNSPAYGRETVDAQRVEVAFVGRGPGRVELVAPTHPGSPVARFLERRGSGLHHICYRVPDLRAALTAHRTEGMELIDSEPRIGAHGHLVAFLHPRSTGGVLVELLESTSD